MAIELQTFSLVLIGSATPNPLVGYPIRSARTHTHTFFFEAFSNRARIEHWTTLSHLAQRIS